MLAALAFCLAGTAQAASPVSASQAWIRWLPGELPLAGYVTLRNRGAHPLKLVGASSPAFARIEFHRSMEAEGMSRMQPAAAVTIPAYGEFRFAPGRYHLMLWRKQPIEIGDQLPIVFEFNNGERSRVVFAVKGPA